MLHSSPAVCSTLAVSSTTACAAGTPRPRAHGARASSSAAVAPLPPSGGSLMPKGSGALSVSSPLVPAACALYSFVSSDGFSSPSSGHSA
eukprot:6680210-Prymnesium_polylepis.1